MVPASGTPDEIPKGAAIVASARPGWFLVFTDPRVRFGERCARALANGQPRQLQPAGMTRVGWFDDQEGKVRLDHTNAAALDRWLGSRAYLNDLQAVNNRDERRRRARRLMAQGRVAEAFRVDRRPF